MREKGSTLREYYEALLIAAIFLGFSNTFVIKTFFIPSSSMEDTLLVGDHLFVNRFIYGPGTELERRLAPLREIRRGDVVIFRSPEDPENDLVKRCIGVPGDEILIESKELFVNGKPVDDALYARHGDAQTYSTRRSLPKNARLRDNFGPFTVPADEYFFLGDNRDFSHDSRFWGTVPRHFIKGRAFLVYWSYEGETSDGKWRGWGDKLAQLGKTVAGFAPRSRWSRTFHLIR
ncbi:MAG TPA: signal peptidase I [Thermoanaerobaculia bacterium]|jgi:signal peptidase I